MKPSKEKLCRSCHGPLSEFSKEEIINPDYCPYCVDGKGEVKGYRDIIESMIQYIKEDHKEIPQNEQISTAQKWLKETPEWKDKFVSNDVVIEDIREQNLKDIPVMNKNKNYDCNVCMYYLKTRNERAAKNKKEWFQNMYTKYGSCAKILYYKGNPVGFAQFAPKKEFIKLEELKPKSTKTDAWYISCIAIKEKFQGKDLGKLLLKNVIEDLKKRGIKKVQACGQLKGNAQNFSSGYWKMYKDLGFEEISKEDNFKVGEIRMK